MLVLAWDTSTEATRLGLFRVQPPAASGSTLDPGPTQARGSTLDSGSSASPVVTDASVVTETLETKTGDGRGGHSATLPPAIDSLLKRHALKPSDLDLLAVGRGPGSFTGLRTGLALAKGLAMGAGLPALGLSSLTVLAGQASPVPSPNGPGLVASVIDARHGEVFCRLFRPPYSGTPLPEPLSEILVLKPDQTPLALKALDPDNLGILMVGPAVSLLPPPPTGLAIGSTSPPDPALLAAQAAFRLLHNLTDDCPLTPLYGRSPDIFKKWTPPIRLPANRP